MLTENKVSFDLIWSFAASSPSSSSLNSIIISIKHAIYILSKTRKYMQSTKSVCVKILAKVFNWLNTLKWESDLLNKSVLNKALEMSYAWK